MLVIVFAIFFLLTYKKWAAQGKLNLYSLVYQIIRFLFFIWVLISGVLAVWDFIFNFFKGNLSGSMFIGTICYIVRFALIAIAGFVGAFLAHPLYFGSKMLDGSASD